MAKKHKPLDRSAFTIYRDKKMIKPGLDQEKAETDPKRALLWWEMNEDQMGGSIQSTIQFMVDHSPGRYNQLLTSTRLYSNNTSGNFIGGAVRANGSIGNQGSLSNSNRISFNLCASITDTITAKMAKNVVVPTFITSGGIWGMQKQAEQLSKFVEGCFYANETHEKGVMALRDACVWGTGVLHVYRHNDQVALERVFPHEIIVDEIEASTGKPQQMHRVKIVDRSVLLFEYRNNKKALEVIRNASGNNNPMDLGFAGQTAADLLTISESWKLANTEDSNDGLHVVCIGGEVIECEDYNKTFFPFVFLNYSKRLVGFWGQGAVERTQNLQAEINRLMILIQKSMWMGGGFKILIENGSKIVKQHLDNEVGTIITYSNTPPSYITPPMIQQDIYPYVDSLIAKGYQQEGVSQLAASSLKPQGVDSGAALRTFDNIAEDRQMFLAQEVQKMYLEVARLMIETVSDIAKDLGDYEVVYPGTLSFEKIEWKKINLKKDEYVMKAYPTSGLSDEPGAKLATVQEYMQAGLVTPRQGRKLLAMPDVEMSDKLANAAEDLLSKIIEDMLEEGEYRAPEPFYDLTLAKQLVLEYYNYAALNNCPEEKLELLRQFSNQIDDLTGVNIMPAPVDAAPVGTPSEIPMPMANPTTTPVSPLIPNVNPIV